MAADGDDEPEAKEPHSTALPQAPSAFSQTTELAVRTFLADDRAFMQQQQHQYAVRISLADQLMEKQYSAPVTAPSYNAWSWYEEAQWNTETPQKLPEVNYMPLEQPMETPDKHLMACHGMMQYPSFEASKAFDEHMAMPSEASMIPHRLFDSTPEKCDRGLCEIRSMHSDSTTVESSESLPSPHKADAPMSPARPSKPHEMMSSPSGYLQQSPIMSAPRRLNFVPETPSPERMHFSCMHPAMHFSEATYEGGALPWHLGMQGHDQVIPEFLQAMPYTGPEPRVLSLA
jgi:hypothetical protein